MYIHPIREIGQCVLTETMALTPTTVSKSVLTTPHTLSVIGSIFAANMPLATARSSFRKIRSGPADVAHDEWIGQVIAYSSDVTDEDWEQPRMLWKIFKDKAEDDDFIGNLSSHVNKALPEVQKETIGEFKLLDVVFCLRHAKHTRNVHQSGHRDRETPRRSPQEA